jgi:formylglycine-generating enzyme required for sulfatase activity
MRVVAGTLMALMVSCTQQHVELPTVTIETEPEPGAHVVIRGENYGETPVTITELRPGPTAIEVLKEGYKPANELINVPVEGELRVVVELRPLVGFITIETEPDAAKVYLHGTDYLGETPLYRVPIPVGEHEMQLVKDNHQPLQMTLEVAEDYVYEYRHQLTPMRSSLAIVSIPTGATIWINEAQLDQTTPTRVDLPPGLHSVTVHAKGHIAKDEVVRLAPAEQRSLEVRLVQGDVPPNMVLVPAGEFIMGSDQSPHERPPRKVFVDTFYIDRFEVTNQQFKAVFPHYEFPEGEELFPARGITWNQAAEYAAKVDKRLPTEAEWEKAARGDDGRVYPWGNEFNRDWVNSAESFGAVPRKVGFYREGQSPYGCMDMAGNVYEWTSDWYRAYPGNTEISRDYGQLFRVLRGGSFMVNRFDVRTSARHFDKQDARREDYGFRCAKDAQ